MIIKTFTEPPIDNNNYIIIDQKTKEAALVDCSHFDRAVVDFIKEQKANLKYILLTHGHFDHVSGIDSYKSNPDLSPDIKVYMHKDDLNQLKNINAYLSFFGIPDISEPKIDVFVEEGDIIKLGNLEIKVLYTPGHTQGGVCYLVDGCLFSGDTIFRECVGRCDLEGGDFQQIVESIENKIFTLPDKTTIYPGHGCSTTVEWEKEHNKFA